MAGAKKNKSAGKAKRQRPNRLVAVGTEDKAKLVELALAAAREAALRPPPPPKVAVSDLVRDLAREVREGDTDLSEEAVVDGIMAALNAGIFGDSFIAPARGAVQNYISGADKTRGLADEPSESSGFAGYGDGHTSAEDVPASKLAPPRIAADDSDLHDVPF